MSEERFDRIDRKLAEHDKRFDRIDQKFAEHDKRFDRIDQKFAEHDQKLAEHDQKFGEHDQQLHTIELRLDGLRADMTNGFVELRRHMGVLHEEVLDRIAYRRTPRLARTR